MLRPLLLVPLLACDAREACLAVPDDDVCPPVDEVEDLFRGGDPSGVRVIREGDVLRDLDGHGVTCCYTVVPEGD